MCLLLYYIIYDWNEHSSSKCLEQGNVNCQHCTMVQIPQKNAKKIICKKIFLGH